MGKQALYFWSMVFWEGIKKSFNTSSSKIQHLVCFVVGCILLLQFQGPSILMSKLFEDALFIIIPFVVWFLLKAIWFVLIIPVENAKIIVSSESLKKFIDKLINLKIQATTIQQNQEDRIAIWIKDCNKEIEAFFGGQDNPQYQVFNRLILGGLVQKIIMNVQMQKSSPRAMILDYTDLEYRLATLDWIINSYLPYTVPCKAIYNSLEKRA